MISLLLPRPMLFLWKRAEKKFNFPCIEPEEE